MIGMLIIISNCDKQKLKKKEKNNNFNLMNIRNNNIDRKRFLISLTHYNYPKFLKGEGYGEGAAPNRPKI